MAACRKVQGSSKKSCKDMLKEEIKAGSLHRSSPMIRMGMRMRVMMRMKRQARQQKLLLSASSAISEVSEIGRTISACMKVCRVRSSKFSCYKKCTEEAKEAAAAATAADKDEIDEVTVTLDTESAAEERAAEVCEGERIAIPRAQRCRRPSTRFFPAM